MIIGGIHKFSLIDFPGKIAAVIFTRGCNFRCPYCHNPQLVLPRRFQLPLDNDEILDFLKKRFGRLDGVAITGGEPLLQDDLELFIRNIKNIGYQVKLDTNGSKPAELYNLLKNNLIDYVAMDIKAPFDSYSKIVQVPVNVDQIKKSMRVIRQSGVKYEFRTTVVNKLMSIEDVKNIAELLEENEMFFIQNFIDSLRVGHKSIEMQSFPKNDIEDIADFFNNKKINCSYR